MSPAVAITQNGAGVAYLFDSFDEADEHPLVQYGDVIADSADRLWDAYNRLDRPLFARFMDSAPRVAPMLEDIGRHSREDTAEARDAAERHKVDVWETVLRCARKPPADPLEILAAIRSDRIASRQGNPRVNRGSGAAATEDDEDMADREVFRMSDEGVITFGTDEKGAKYGADNVPKKSDDTKALFGKYREGMTVKEALAAGLSRSNIRRDRRKGFINIKNPPAAAAETKTDAPAAAAAPAAGGKKK